MIETATKSKEPVDKKRVETFLKEFAKRYNGDLALLENEQREYVEKDCKAGEIYAAPLEMINRFIDGWREGYSGVTSDPPIPNISNILKSGRIISYVTNTEFIPTKEEMERHITIVSWELLRSLYNFPGIETEEPPFFVSDPL